jgi:hypothetical protein
MLEQPLLIALRALTARLKHQPVNWAITASCGLALQGVPVRVRDIDLATDRSGAYRLAQLFAAEVTHPVQLSSVETVRSHYGAFALEGYTFEIIGDSQYRHADGGWDAPLDFTPHKHFVRVDGMSLPVLTLEFEVESYARLGRSEKVKLLAEWLGR